MSADWSKMELLRKMGGLCYFKERATKGQKVEVESVSGGEDVLDAATTEEKVCPEHLVVMVNGIIGRYVFVYMFVYLFYFVPEVAFFFIYKVNIAIRFK